MGEGLPGGVGRGQAGLAAGSRIAGYLLEEEIGAGGTAVVFRGRDERLDRLVALKVLAPGLAADEEFRRRFLRESRAAAAVDDPHIVPVYEAGETVGVLFIAMRLVSGGDVRGLLRREGPLPPGRVAAIVSPVASALDAAHGAGLVHRDVKPANMLIDARPGGPDHVYLSDFGLARAGSASALTGTGVYLGTAGYMAPEQIQGEHIDGRADQYALGCAVFELLCGQRPFERDQDVAVIYAHLSVPPPEVASRRPDLPPAVDEVLGRALAKTPDDRYASCGEFAEALRQALGLPGYDRDPGIMSLATAPAAAGAAGEATVIRAVTTDGDRGPRELPAGTITMLFSDIEGSTRLVKAPRERYAQVLAEHGRLVRSAIAAHGGHEVDTQGDAFFAVFGRAKQAVLCALDVQRALAAHRWPGDASVRVRIGIHTGQAVPAGAAYTGLAVHRAARICAAAQGGQVLISQATQTLIEDEEEELGFVLADVGERRLKDLDRPVRLFQLTAAGLDTQALPGGGRRVTILPRQPVPGRPAGSPGAGVHGLPAALTSFIGRREPVREITGLLGKHRLVTVTGPGGSGKTRLAGEVASRMAGRFADGAWVTELAMVQEPAQVASVVAAALGVPELPGVAAGEVLSRVLARLQLLLELDNCEHVIGAAAELCAALLAAADDVTILATSREPLRVAGEARYRLAPLALPDLDDLAGAARAEAVALFTDRARRADMHFALDETTGPSVARLVTRLDGMPLAIELAAARVEALGVTGLLDRLDDRFAVLAGGDRTAPSRQKSLAATVEWSYQLLDETERRVFRHLSVFPGPFTLEAAEEVAGADAGTAVLHLVDCSLLIPPRAGPDGRSRYGMLETLRAYGTRLLAQAGERDQADAALAGYALAVAEQAAAGLQTSSGEQDAARWLDAEDAMMRQVLGWAMDHDPAPALRLAVALAPWWVLRGRGPGGYPVLREAAGRAVPGESAWCEAQLLLGDITGSSGDLSTSLEHYTALYDATADRGPSRALARCLGGRSYTLANLGRVAEALDDARRALAMARDVSDPEGQALALQALAVATSYAGDPEGAVRFARQAGQIPADISGSLARAGEYILTATLMRVGDTAAAEDVCVAALARTRKIGDQWNLAHLLSLMAELDRRVGRHGDAARHLREALQVILRTGHWFEMGNVLDSYGYLCAATGRPAEAVTLLAASDAVERASQSGVTETMPWVARRRETLREARQVLAADAGRAAKDRGTAMSAATAAEYVLLLTSPAQPASGPDAGQLSAAERELITLVAQGRTDAQIAAQLHTGIRAVRSQLDRIRDKTGCRRRADLTRLALTAGLV